MEEKLRIVFFASGDFPYPTLKAFLECQIDDVVGIVTSNYKPEFQDDTVKDLAIKYNVPYIVIDKEHTLKDEDTIEWLKEKDADIFCVISFKYLPREIREIPHITSFNVHASLLPFLRGAAPINWAIKYGFKETGLTSFVLDERIDTGEIISNLKIPIEDGDDYGLVFTRLSYGCIGLTIETLRQLRNEDWRGNTILQPDCGINMPYMKAPKLTEKNMTLPIQFGEIEDIEVLYKHIQSLSPNIGTPCKLQVYKVSEHKKVGEGNYVFANSVLYKEFDIKIYKAQILDELVVNPPIDDYKKYMGNFKYGNVTTDGKSFMALVGNSGVTKTLLFIKEIQIAGKKKLPIKDFLAGFQLSREKGMYFTITGKD